MPADTTTKIEGVMDAKQVSAEAPACIPKSPGGMGVGGAQNQGDAKFPARCTWEGASTLATELPD
jgi:hypothetical protein